MIIITNYANAETPTNQEKFSIRDSSHIVLAKAIVSHSTGVKKEDLSSIDMLPEIKHELFLAPKLSPLSTKMMT